MARRGAAHVLASGSCGPRLQEDVLAVHALRCRRAVSSPCFWAGADQACHRPPPLSRPPSPAGNVLNDPANYRTCACCGRKSLEMKLCGACKRATYCSAECQKQDWLGGHKEACAGRQRKGSVQRR